MLYFIIVVIARVLEYYVNDTLIIVAVNSGMVKGFRRSGL